MGTKLAVIQNFDGYCMSSADKFRPTTLLGVLGTLNTYNFFLFAVPYPLNPTIKESPKLAQVTPNPWCEEQLRLVGCRWKERGMMKVFICT